MGIAINFNINGTECLVPMAVEETSLIAAASHITKLARETVEFHPTARRLVMRAQIQVMELILRALRQPYSNIRSSYKKQQTKKTVCFAR